MRRTATAGKIYDTNAQFAMYEDVDDRILPTHSRCTPDGAISDRKSGILLAVEASASQTIEAVQKKMQSFFHNPSVIAGIIINLDETPAYASPTKHSNWDSDGSPVTLAEWDEVQSNEWGPMYFGGHRWGGRFTCQIEVHWPYTNGDQKPFTAVSPLFRY
jgi:hypothetical protein